MNPSDDSERNEKREVVLPWCVQLGPTDNPLEQFRDYQRSQDIPGFDDEPERV